MVTAGSRILGTVRRISELGPRLPGSDAERACHSMIMDHLKGIGHGSYKVEEFEFLNWVPISQRLLGKSSGLEIPVQQLGYSASGRVKGNLEYCGGGTRDECHPAAGKIAVCSSGWEDSLRFLHRIKKYRNAVEAGAQGFVLVGEPGHDLPFGIIRKRQTGSIPAVAVGYEDGNRLLQLCKEKESFLLSVENKTLKDFSQNIIWRIGGPSPGIVLCAHYDSWTQGAWDNASGVAVLLELAEWLPRQRLRRDVTLCFAGAEEFGLWGSRHFCSKHAIDSAFAINVDGVGYRGSRLQARCSDLRLTSIQPLKGTYSELPLTTSGDHWSFHRAGVRTIFVTCNGSNPVQHTEEDRAECLNPDGLESSMDLLSKMVTYLDSII